MSRKTAYYLLLAGWIFFGLISIFCFEKIPLNDGLGYDGKIYGDIVYHFPSILSSQTLSSYYTQRILPSVIVSIVLRLFHLPLSNNTIAIAFCFLNLISILLCIVIWNKISRRYNLGFSAWLFGCIALLINFPVLKDAFFDPVATDYCALLLGFAMIWFYLQKNEIVLFLLIVAGFFTWPLSIYAGSVLFIFCRYESQSGKKNLDLRKLFFIGTLLLLAASLIYGLLYLHRFKPNTKYSINLWLLILSIPVIIIYLLSISKLAVFNFLPDSAKKFKREIIKSVIMLLTFFFLHFLIAGWADTSQYSVSPPSVIMLSFLRGVERPFIFIVGHFAYFGPLIIILILFRNEIWKNLMTDLGLQLFALIHLLLAVNSESRFLMMGLPVFILFASLILNKYKITKGFLLTFFLVSLVVSKIWLPFTLNLNEENWGESAYRYYSVFGPWMNQFWYITQLSFMLACIFLFYRLKKNISPLSLSSE